jgi:hypothetical protein
MLPHSAANMQPSPCSVGNLYHPKPPLANSISLFDALWKKANIKRFKNKRPIYFKKRTIKALVINNAFFLERLFSSSIFELAVNQNDT